MNATVLLVLLTISGSAPLGVNFVNFDNLPACEKRAAQLRKILTAGGVRIVENRCVESFQRFTRHRHRETKGDHGAKAAEKRNVYLVALNAHRAIIVPKPDMKACETARAHRGKAGAATRYFCALSEQRLLCDAAAPQEKPRP